jgi:hypothetical protein
MRARSVSQRRGPYVLSDVRELAQRFLEELDSPRALSISILLKYEGKGETWAGEEILRLSSVNPLDYLTHDSFFRDYQAAKLLSKWDGLKTGRNLELEAWKKFQAAEDQCRSANRRIRTQIPDGRVGEVLSLARKIICDALGEVTPVLLERVAADGGWGTGVTSSNKGPWQSAYNKMTPGWESTPALRQLMDSFLRESPSLTHAHPQGGVAIGGNSLSFVPKDAKAHRSIAVEPSFNAYLQRGVGLALRRRLKHRLGVDLQHGQSINSELARIGSIDGSLATLDLSSASDTIAKATVELLFPSSWTSLLGLLRSEHYSYKNVLRRYEKWSSMGNGYTFELETFLFASIVKAVCIIEASNDPWAVYGDDIVCPTQCTELIVQTLEWLGFALNKDKSYPTGPFRESCGEDYFLGELVRPYFFKKVGVQTIYVFANWLRLECPTYINIESTWNWCYYSTPAKLRYRVPQGDHGLLGFVSNDWEVDPSYATLLRRPYGPFIVYRISGLVWQPRTALREESSASVAACLYLADRVPVTRDEFGRSRYPSDPLDQRYISGRELGRWVQRSRIHQDQWAAVRIF